jgi:hypothetical protein
MTDSLNKTTSEKTRLDLKLDLAPRANLWKVRMRRGPPRIKRDHLCLTKLFQNQKEKNKKQYDTKINHIHLMEIIMQETADLYVMLFPVKICS